MSAEKLTLCLALIQVWDWWWC